MSCQPRRPGIGTVFVCWLRGWHRPVWRLYGFKTMSATYWMLKCESCGKVYKVQAEPPDITKETLPRAYEP